jgi:ATP-dependent RNA helicase DDX19/DBP5
MSENLVASMSTLDLAPENEQLHSGNPRISGGIYVSATMWQDATLFQNNQPLLNGISQMDWNRPSRIQGQALPQIIRPGPDGKWRNLKAQAQHGSGKTGTFCLAMLARVDVKSNSPQAICLGPTREVAQMTASVVRSLGQYLGVRVALVVPADRGKQKRPASVTEQIVVGTPGSVYNRIRLQKISANTVKMLVIDEADECLRQQRNGGGLASTINSIKAALPSSIQVLLFSATFYLDQEPQIQRFLGRDNKTITIEKETQDLMLENVQHFYLDAADEKAKMTALSDLYDVATSADGGQARQSIIFVKSFEIGTELANKMTQDGYTVFLFSGRLSPQERDQAMKDFKDRKKNVLIATNVLGRGVDVPAVQMVVNWNFPLLHNQHGPDAETYVHRMHRAGRFGRKGVGITLCDNAQEIEYTKQVCSKFGIQAHALPGEDFAVLEKIVTESLEGKSAEARATN